MGAWHITRKDLLLLCRDRRTLAVLLIMPLVFIAVLGISTGQLFGEGSKKDAMRLVVVDEDRGALASELIAALAGRKEFDVEPAATHADADELIHVGDRLAKITIGGEFQARVDALEIGDVLDSRRGKLSGGMESLDITVDIEDKPSLVVTRVIIEQSVFGEALRTLLPYIASKNPAVSIYLQSVRAQADAAEKQPPEPVEQQPQTAAGDDQQAGGSIVYKFLVPGYTVCFAFFLINIMARSFLAERDLGTLRRLKAAPIGAVALLSGKTVPFFLVSLVQVVLLFLCGRMLFGMSWGEKPWMLLPVLVGTSLSATALGLLVAALVRSDAQVTAYGNLTVITLAAVSGCFMPRDWMPELMQQLSLATPHAWALIAYTELLATTAPDLALVWQSCGMLVVFTAAFVVLGAWRFRSLV